MPVVDVHVHIYPDKISEKATQSVGRFYSIEMDAQDGSVSKLEESIAGSDITHCVVCSVAVKPQTVGPINDFIAREVEGHDNFMGFMAMHQDFDDPAAEIERAMGLGLCGIKLHPDTQEVNMDDPRLMRVYDIAQACHLPLTIHCGDYRYDYSHPRRLKRILHEFPDLVVNAAHFGGWSIQDLALEFLEDERCFMDMSSSMFSLGPRRTRELVYAHGTDRMLFGSDFPMWEPVAEYEQFSSLGFTDAELEDMCWHNAERFLGRTIR
ncbi:MAG: amidohydrolase family protein [Atopobiaceae bacterium]|nr:amidohydrolase family protein [Atopobiaceae bacterium]